MVWTHTEENRTGTAYVSDMLARALQRNKTQRLCRERDSF